MTFSLSPMTPMPKIGIIAPQKKLNQPVLKPEVLENKGFINSLAYGNYIKAITFTGEKTFQDKYNQLKEEIISGKHKDRWLYASDVKKYMKTVTKDNIDAIRFVLDAKKPDGSPQVEIIGHNVIPSLSNEKIPFYKELLSCKFLDGSAQRIQWFDFGDIVQGITDESYPHLKVLLNAENEDHTDYRFIQQFPNDDKWYDKNLIWFTSEGESRLIPENLELLKEMMELKNAQGKYIFNGTKSIGGTLLGFTDSDIPKLKELAQNGHDEYDISLYARLKMMGCDEVFDDFMHYKEIGRYTPEDIKEISERFTPNSLKTVSQIKTVLEAKDCHGNYRFAHDDLGIWTQMKADLEPFQDFLINAKASDGFHERFSSEDISTILCTFNWGSENIGRFVDVVQYFMDAKKPDNNDFLLDGDHISSLADYYTDGLPIKAFIEGTPIAQLSSTEKLGYLHFLRHLQLGEEYANREIATMKSMPFDHPLEILNSYQDINPLKQDLIKSLGLFAPEVVKTKLPINAESLEKLDLAVKDLETSLKNAPITKYGEVGLPLQYTRRQFVEDVNALIDKKGVDEHKEMLLGFFDFSINGEKIEGAPVPKELSFENIKNYLDKVNSPLSVGEALNLLSPLSEAVEKFTVKNNFIIPNHPNLSEDLTTIAALCPEFLSSIGKKQHKTHKYTLDVHMMETLKQIYAQPEYQSLSEEEKKVLTMATLFHDIAKTEGEVDKGHAESSEILVCKMLNRLNMDDRLLERICCQVKNHHWVELLENKSLKERDVAVDFRRPGDFKLGVMLAKADLNAVGNPDFTENIKDNYQKYTASIESFLDTIHSESIYLPQARIPKASELKAPEMEIGSGNEKTTNTVVTIDKETDFEALGFDKGTDLDHFATFVHVSNSRRSNLLDDISYASKEGGDGIFSTSYVTPRNYQCYHDTAAFMFEVDPSNVALAYPENIGSGLEKTYEQFQNFLFKEVDKDNVLASRGKYAEVMTLKDPALAARHKELFQELASKPYFSDLEDPLLRETLTDLSVETMFNQGKGGHNEAVVYAPKHKGFICTDSVDKIPYNYRQYAEENDLPLFVIKEQDFIKEC